MLMLCYIIFGYLWQHIKCHYIKNEVFSYSSNLDKSDAHRLAKDKTLLYQAI